MNPTLARILLRFYPSAWRTRYAREFEQLLLTTPANPRSIANILVAACRERLFPIQRSAMTTDRTQPTFGNMIHFPSAFLPLAMSIIAIGILATALITDLIHTGGIVRSPDEGAAAHLWQIMIAGQLPIVLFFAIKWLPRAPRQSLSVLALQAGAVLASMAPVFFLGL